MSKSLVEKIGLPHKELTSLLLGLMMLVAFLSVPNVDKVKIAESFFSSAVEINREILIAAIRDNAENITEALIDLGLGGSPYLTSKPCTVVIDWVRVSGTKYYFSQNGTSGYLLFASTNGSEVLYPAFAGGRRVMIRAGIYEYDVELFISGAGISTPVNQTIIEGEGRNTVLRQITDNKRSIVVINRACFALYDLRIDHPTSNTEIALQLSAEGGLSESSCKYSQMNNVWIKGGDGTHELARFENIGHGLTVGYLKIQAPNGDALNISNPSPTNNYGNSAFDHLELSADPVDGTCLTIWSPDQNIEMNSLTFHHLDCSTTSGTDVRIVNSKRVIIEWLISEHFAECSVNITGYAGGKKSQQIVIQDGLIIVPNGAQAFDVNLAEACYIKAWVTGETGAGLVLRKGYNDKMPNEFDLNLRGTYDPYAAGDFDINTVVTSPIMKLRTLAPQRTPNWNSTAGVSDGDTIPHMVGITPTVYGAWGTVAGEMVSVTAVNAATLTIAIKDDAGNPGTPQTISWYAGWLP